MRPNTNPAATATAVVKSTTRALIEMSTTMKGIRDVIEAMKVTAARYVRPTPSTAPADANKALYVIS